MKTAAIVAGFSMLGFLIPEVLSVFGKVRINLATNVWSMVAFGLISFGVFAV